MESIGNRKVGKNLVHPLGPKKISELLNGIPQYDELTIFYKDKPGEPIGEKSPGWGSKKLKGNSTDFLTFHCLIDVSYNGMRDSWTLNIYPTSKEASDKTRTFMAETGLVIVKNWLNETRPETWYEGYRHLLIGTTENISEYCVFETHGERVVNKWKNST